MYLSSRLPVWLPGGLERSVYFVGGRNGRIYLKRTIIALHLKFDLAFSP